MGIEDIEMRIIKWEKIWNDKRERERERERYDICYKYKSNRIVKDYCNFKDKESITVGIVKENSWPQYFFGVHFLMKNEIMDYFYVIGWMSYKFKWSKIFILFVFLFFNRLFVK